MRVNLVGAAPVYLSAYHALHAVQLAGTYRPGFKVLSIILMDEHPDDELTDDGAKKTVGRQHGEARNT
jgi:hypothetical protein